MTIDAIVGLLILGFLGFGVLFVLRTLGHWLSVKLDQDEYNERVKSKNKGKTNDRT